MQAHTLASQLSRSTQDRLATDDAAACIARLFACVLCPLHFTRCIFFDLKLSKNAAPLCLALRNRQAVIHSNELRCVYAIERKNKKKNTAATQFIERLLH
jgi:hypothetical protein